MLFASRIASCFVSADGLPVNYLLNPKSGCSTILQYLWRVLDKQRGTTSFAGNPHAKGPWLEPGDWNIFSIEEIAARPTFSVVRNPYARALSAYLSKVGERKEDAAVGEDLFVWNQFREHFALPPDAQPSFDEYLEMIETEPAEMMDRHWSPQYYNLLQPVARVDRVFYLEDFVFPQAFLRGYFGEMMPRSSFGYRDARYRLRKFYTPSAIERVERIYAIDFETFGYSKSMEQHRVRRPVDRLPGSPEGLTPFLKYMAVTTTPARFEHLDRFERLNEADFSTAMARFMIGGSAENQATSIEAMLAAKLDNWMALREVATVCAERGMGDEALRIEAAADAAHRRILERRSPPAA